jgi:hypothetical protein
MRPISADVDENLDPEMAPIAALDSNLDEDGEADLANDPGDYIDEADEGLTEPSLTAPMESLIARIKSKFTAARYKMGTLHGKFTEGDFRFSGACPTMTHICSTGEFLVKDVVVW